MMRLAYPALFLAPCVAAFTMTVALASCDAGPAAPTPVVLEVPGSQDAAGAVDPARCADLDECSCAQTPGCTPVTTDCWCAPAGCGSDGSCACQGGRYLGCNPTSAACGTAHCSLLSHPSLRDAHGCIQCTDPPDCATAVSTLAATCPALPETDMQWICGGALESCSTFCMGALRTCESAGCALCLDCSCGNDLFDSCVNECVSSAQNRH
jgi:hypothetical protein